MSCSYLAGSARLLGRALLRLEGGGMVVVTLAVMSLIDTAADDCPQMGTYQVS